jgi:SsrA-binding protein
MPTLALNKKANFNYNLQETFEAGLVLRGYETKAIKDGHVSLIGAYISTRFSSSGHPELFLVGAHVSKYKHAGLMEDYNPLRERKLLMKKTEINYLIGKKQTLGLTLIPLKIYTKRSLVKIEIALAQGKKKYDKREDLKKRDIDRQIQTLTKRSFKK